MMWLAFVVCVSAQNQFSFGQTALGSAPTWPLPTNIYSPASAAPTLGQFPTDQSSAIKSASSSTTPLASGQLSPTPAPAPNDGPSDFDLHISQRLARIEPINVVGNRVSLNVPLSAFVPNTGGQFDSLSNVGTVLQAKWAGKQENVVSEQIRHLRRTTPTMTQDSANKLQDLRLQKDLFHNVKLRRTFAAVPITLPGGSRLSNYFEGRSHQNELDLARNRLDDDRRAFAQDPSPENQAAIRNDLANIRQAKQFQTANSLDLIGTRFGNAGRFGAILRTKADNTAVNTAQRARRVAEDNYAEDPDAENWIKLRIAQLQEKIWKTDAVANKQQIIGNFGGGALGTVFGLIGNAVSVKKEEDYANRIAKLNLALVRLQRAESQSGTHDDTADRMLALSSYGGSNNYGTAPGRAVPLTGLNY